MNEKTFKDLPTVARDYFERMFNPESIPQSVVDAFFGVKGLVDKVNSVNLSPETLAVIAYTAQLWDIVDLPVEPTVSEIVERAGYAECPDLVTQAVEETVYPPLDVHKSAGEEPPPEEKTEIPAPPEEVPEKAKNVLKDPPDQGFDWSAAMIGVEVVVETSDGKKEGFFMGFGADSTLKVSMPDEGVTNQLFHKNNVRPK